MVEQPFSHLARTVVRNDQESALKVDKAHFHSPQRGRQTVEPRNERRKLFESPARSHIQLPDLRRELYRPSGQALSLDLLSMASAFLWLSRLAFQSLP